MLNFGRDNTSKVAKWWRNINKEILFLFAFLFLLGLFFSFSSTSSVVADKMNKEMYFFFIKHLTFVSISLFLIVTISIIDKKTLIRFLPYLFFISIFFLLLTPFIGTEVKGSKRWLDLFFLPRFQPVELVKPLFVIFVAKVIATENKTKINKRYFYSFLILLLIVFLLINQPDLGQTLLLVLTWITIIFVSGFNMIFLTIFCFFFLLNI
jgi:cell division protein FtsW